MGRARPAGMNDERPPDHAYHAAPPEPQPPAEPLVELEATRAELLRLIAPVADERWTWRPAPGQPSLAETLARLPAVDCWALRAIRALDAAAELPPLGHPNGPRDPLGTPLPAVDEPPGTRLLRVPDLRAELQAARSELLRALRALDESAWDRTGYEPTLGETSVRGIVRFLVQHERDRSAAISRILDEVGTGLSGPGYRPPDRTPDPEARAGAARAPGSAGSIGAGGRPRPLPPLRR